MKILIDMNLSPKWVGVLVSGGLEATHWSRVGPIGSEDSEIMSYAHTNDFAVLTHDLDFGTILAATGGAKPSVIQLRTADVSPEAAGREVLASILQMAPELERGALLTIGPAKSRMRLLPLG